MSNSKDLDKKLAKWEEKAKTLILHKKQRTHFVIFLKDCGEERGGE